MFSKAVICSDLSPVSDSLIASSRGLHHLGVSEVVLAHVADASSERAVDIMREGVTDDPFLRQISTLEDAGFLVHIDAVVSHPAYSIQELVERHEPDLIVLTSDSRDACGLALATHGGPVRLAALDVPILTVSSKGLSQGRSVFEQLLSRVLFPVHLSGGEQQAVAMAEAMSATGLGSLMLLHVSSPVQDSVGSVKSEKNLRRNLETLQAELSARGARAVRTKVLQGSPARVICQEARLGEYSLVLLNSPGSSRDGTHPHGEIRERLLQEAANPLMFVPMIALKSAERVG